MFLTSTNHEKEQLHKSGSFISYYSVVTFQEQYIKNRGTENHIEQPQATDNQNCMPQNNKYSTWILCQTRILLQSKRLLLAARYHYEPQQVTANLSHPSHPEQN